MSSTMTTPFGANPNLIQPAKLTPTQLKTFGFKKIKGLPPGTYVSTVHNILRLRLNGLLKQYLNNRGLPVNSETGLLALRKQMIDSIKGSFDPFALGEFGFSLTDEGSTLTSTTAHHRTEALQQLKDEGYDLSGLTVMVKVGDEDSLVRHYTLEGEHWSQTVGQRVTNPDLVYGHYYSMIQERALKEKGIKISSRNLPHAQVSQVVEVFLTGQKELLTAAGKFGKVWNGRHDIKGKANTTFADASKEMTMLSPDEEYQLFEAALWLNRVLEGTKQVPIPVDAIKSLSNLPMFKGLLFAGRVGLTHQERTKASTKKWAALAPERLAVRLATNPQALRDEAQAISSGTQEEQRDALVNLQRLLNTSVRNEKAMGVEIAKKVDAKLAAAKIRLIKAVAKA